MIGTTGEELVLEAGEDAAARCAAAGTLAGWQREVAACAAGNPVAAFCVSAAFVGPLLDQLSEASGGVHLAGKSKIGKTLACRLAASVWGPPHKAGALRDWHATANAFEVAAEEASDGLLILDEIHQADPRAAVGVVYSLAGEAGRARLTREAQARRRRTWRVFVLSNGEVGLDAVAARAGQRLPAGAAVRLPSIPVTPEAGWRALHGAADFEALAGKLNRALGEHHGHAGRAFIERVIETGPRKIAEMVDATRKALALALPADASAQVRDVARRLALIAAAGELATEWTILGWQRGEAWQATQVMLQAWLAAREGAGHAEDQEALARTRGFIAEHGSARFVRIEGAAPETADGRAVVKRAGFIKRIDGADVYLIFPDVWRGEVHAGADPMAAARSLAAASLLLRGKEKLQRRERVPGFSTPVWVVSDGVV